MPAGFLYVINLSFYLRNIPYEYKTQYASNAEKGGPPSSHLVRVYGETEKLANKKLICFSIIQCNPKIIQSNFWKRNTFGSLN